MVQMLQNNVSSEGGVVVAVREARLRAPHYPTKPSSRAQRTLVPNAGIGAVTRVDDTYMYQGRRSRVEGQSDQLSSEGGKACGRTHRHQNEPVSESNATWHVLARSNCAHPFKACLPQQMVCRIPLYSFLNEWCRAIIHTLQPPPSGTAESQDRLRRQTGIFNHIEAVLLFVSLPLRLSEYTNWYIVST